jgi:hypothetical protein
MNLNASKTERRIEITIIKLRPAPRSLRQAPSSEALTFSFLIRVVSGY